MFQVITATFEDGVLKPSQPLNLAPRTQVRLTIEPLEDDNDSKRHESLTALESLWRHSTVDSQGERLSRDELHERR